ncbi:MAG: septum formation protein Maf, partial [Clostridia bacterium]|nr:septum formation protein Maf [Clostridia bacterium]
MLVLASASPRRRELLKLTGLHFAVRPAKDEINPPQTLPPAEYAVASALYKAREVASVCGKNDIILGADTVVYLQGEIFGKPHCAEDARRMLETLSGRTHYVCTGYAVIKGGAEYTGCAVTEVEFRALSPKEIESYIATGEPMDKAGAYGIQGRASVFVKRINGDYFNVVGLPLCEIY